MNPDRFVTLLLSWFDTHGRDLPWRHTRDPYPIWLSEIILQQTRISQGTAYWERFMTQYPTVEQLAAASEDEVLKLWQGLGYYSRARNLHHAARQIAKRGTFPETLEDIRELKGVGDYTAAAIAAFAYNLPAAAVDGNFHRVLARVFGIETPINTNEGKKLFQALADELISVSPKQSSRINAAMMDFGATQCTPKAPLCLCCPLQEECEARRQGKVDVLPVKLKTVKVKTRRLTYVLVRHEGQIAMRRRGKGDIWQGLWEPILLEDTDIADTPYRHARPVMQNVKHVLTHRVLLADFYLLDRPPFPPLPEGYRWIAESERDRHAVPRLIEKLWQRLDSTEDNPVKD